jgi:riboflavin kinase
MENGKNIIHLTDYAFQKICNVEFGINRGVYNEIDNWFFSKGIVDILERRREILNFIEFNAPNRRQKVRFGSGGLRQKLMDYFDKVAI